MNRLCIVVPWLLLQVGCECSTYQNLAGKLVGKAVEASRGYDNGPMNPPGTNLVHSSNRLEWKLVIGLGAAPTDR
jgi:hypothetical protein